MQGWGPRVIFSCCRTKRGLLEEGGINRDLSKMSTEAYEYHKILFLFKEAAGVKTSGNRSVRVATSRHRQSKCCEPWQVLYLYK